MSGDEAVHDTLSDELASLGLTGHFTLVEFNEDGLAVWTVRRDKGGTPQASKSPVTLDPDGDPASSYERRIAPLLGDRLLLIACTSPQARGELLDLICKRRRVPVHYCQTPLDAQLRDAITGSSLVLDYGLAVLVQRPGTGEVSRTVQQLFAPGASRGSTARVRVRCAPTDGHGTSFAIVTRPPRPDIPRGELPLWPVQVQCAAVPPGGYELEATLSRPGRVKLTGLPANLQSDGTPWADLCAQVPARLPEAGPVHLVCALEVSGAEERVRDRIDRLEQLITLAGVNVKRLAVSVIAYGPHSVAWHAPERPASTVARAVDGTQAVRALRGLAGGRPAPDPAVDREYPDAAQLECALEAAGRLLAGDGARPVLVTAGRRPPHPPAADPGSDLLPCPDGVDWERQFHSLAGLPGITFGALCDQAARDPVWRRLGRDARATVDDAVDIERFAADLGLRVPGQVIPFPFIDERGS
jgi:hypothetical protein